MLKYEDMKNNQVYQGVNTRSFNVKIKGMTQYNTILDSCPLFFALISYLTFWIQIN